MKQVVLLVAFVATAPLQAQTGSSNLPAASTWGAPASGAAVAPAPRPSAPATAFAAARATSTATGDYFHDFGELIVRVRSVKWIEEICSESFPASAALNERAYDDWALEHGDFVQEMEGQFAIIERYWADASPDMKKSGVNAQALRQRVDAQRAGLRDDFHATNAVAFKRRCDAYPEVLLTPQLDLETSQSDYVHSVRAGPG